MFPILLLAIGFMSVFISKIKESLQVFKFSMMSICMIKNPMAPNIKSFCDLPLEVLENIISYVPQRFDLSQVSKSFYELTCEIESGKKVLVIRRDKAEKLNIMDDDIYRSMISTQRFVDKIFISSEIKTAMEFERLKILFMVKFGKTVKEIKWHCYNLNLTDTMTIFGFAPFLSHLEIDDNDWESDEPEFEKDKLDIDSLKQYLKLESLKVSGLANQLFNDNEDDENDECLVDFICSRRLISVDISKLEISPSPVMMFLRKQPHIQKIRLDLHNYGEDNLSSYIPKRFVQLESLDLGRMTWVDVDFSFICDNLTNLKSLVISIGEIGPQILSRLAELSRLQDLTLKCDEEEVDLSYARSESVTSLTIQAKVETPAILNVANNFLNLRKLVLEVPKTVVISSVLHRFVNLEELNLKSNTALKSVIDNCDAKVFPNMKRLALNIRQDFCCDVLDEPEHLLTLLDIMPNLEYLEAAMALELRSKAANKKIIDVLKKVEGKVNSFSFTLQCYLWDEVVLVADLKDIFERVHLKCGPGGCQIIKIN